MTPETLSAGEAKKPEVDQADPKKLPRFARQFVRFDETSSIPCPSDRSPTKMHFFTIIEGMGGKRACRFCGTKESHYEVELSRPTPKQMEIITAIEKARVDIPSVRAQPQREQFEENISRGKAASVARDLSGRHCWTVKRKIGRKKICVLHVDQGESAKSLVFEASDWWMTLRALHVFLKNSGKLSIDESDEGGKLVPA